MRRWLVVALAAFAILAAQATWVPTGPAIAAGSASVIGQVRAPGGGVPDAAVEVGLHSTSTGWLTTTTDPATGAYRFDTLPAGTHYTLKFTYLGSARIVRTVLWPEVYLGYGGQPFRVESGQEVTKDFELKAGAEVSGRILTDDGVDPTVRPYFWFSTTSSIIGDPVDGQGDYRFVVPPGRYFMTFSPPVSLNNSPWKFEYWDEVRTLSEARRVDLTAGNTLSGVDAHLDRAAAIGGDVVVDMGDGTMRPRTGASVYFLREGSTSWFQTDLDATGRYDHHNIQPGRYKICFSISAQDVFPMCHGGTTFDDATWVTVNDGEVVEVDGVVPASGTLVGGLYQQRDVYSAWEPLPTGRVVLWRWREEASEWLVERDEAAPDGTYRFTRLPVGSYVVQVSDSAGEYPTEYLDDRTTFATADVLEVGGMVTTYAPSQALGPIGLTVTRTTGLNRFETSVAISQYLNSWVDPQGVPVVYLANGLNYPDALSAGPAAADGGVVLLSYPWSLPDAVAAELRRIRPQRIVIVGGLNSVDANVEARLSTLGFDTDVVRLAGTDRFGTSRVIALDRFPGGADTVFIATGLNYPDALAAGPPAAMLDAPIILVNGGAASLDSATSAVLSRLGAQRVYLIGGHPSVSAGIEADLRRLVGDSNVTRLTGTDRFGTSVAISQEFYEESDIAFLATGLNFPDALAGGPMAAAFGAPIYLSYPQCVPPVVAEDIVDLGAHGLVLLGGYPSLSAHVETGRVC